MSGVTAADVLPFAIALGLGLLVGLQRQLTHSHIAGIRTFALVTLLGAVAARCAPIFGPATLAAGLLGLAALLVVGNVAKLRAGEVDPGLTTEVAVLVMYGVGALVVVGPRELAIALSGTVALLLHGKARMHAFVDRLGERDVNAIMRFVLISLVVLPLLPDREFGPFAVLNPFDVWRMVVLIVGIGLAGYVGFRIVGGRHGALVNGLLGGLVSSTAATLAAARRAHTTPAATGVAMCVVLLASGVVFIRLIVEIAFVSPTLLRDALLPLGALATLLVGSGIVAWRGIDGRALPPDEPDNPAELRPALIFGALYALVLVASAAAKDRLGDRGLYAVALVSGLTDVDAITLSVSRLQAAGALDGAVAWRAVVLASLSNLAFKAGIVRVLGTRALFALVARRFALVSAIAALFLLLL
jgi:uncharacterized membrane protein (DUF4010 family)